MIEKIRSMKFRTVMLIVALAILTPQLLIAAGETRFFDMIVRNAMSIGTTSAANSKTVLDVVSTTKASRPAPSMSTAQRDAITSPATGSLVYNTDTNKLNQYNGSGWVEVGSGSGQGGVNHITNSDAETNTDGHTLYADAAGTAPVDGTAGTSSLTLTQDTAAELRGNASFKLAKSATNEQGEGVGINFTVALADYNPPKMQTISFDYKPSANFACNAGTASSPSDIVVYIYARDTGALIQPSTFTLDCSGKYVGHFQPLTTDDDYRLILHVATTNALAWDFSYDSVQVGPQNTARGPPITDWQSYSYQMEASTSNPTHGAGAASTVWWRRVGSDMEIRFQYEQSNAGSNGSGTYFVRLPAGHSIDTSKITTTAAAHTFGSAIAFSSTSGIGTGNVVYFSTTSLAMYISNETVSGNTLASTGSWLFSHTTLRMGFTARVPILGWGSNVGISEGDGRAVTAHYWGTSSTVTNAGDTTIVLTTKVHDTHNAYNTSNGRYVCPERGTYRVSGGFETAAITAGTVNSPVIIYINKNGSSVLMHQYMALTTSSAVRTATISGSVSCNVGDYIEMVGNQQLLAGAQALSNSIRTFFTIEKTGGQQTPLPHETVRARYTTAAGQSIETGATGETVIYGTRDYDTHGAFNASTGVFTAPMPGAYRVTAFNYLSSSNQWAAGEPAYLRLYKNGSIYSYLAYYTAESATSKPVPLWGSDTVYLNQGDTVQINIANESGSTIALNSLATVNYVTIEKVGNF